MLDTRIYISVTRGNETLTLDGNLYLFKEFLATLNDKDSQEVNKSPRPTTNPSMENKQPVMAA